MPFGVGEYCAIWGRGILWKLELGNIVLIRVRKYCVNRVGRYCFDWDGEICGKKMLFQLLIFDDRGFKKAQNMLRSNLNSPKKNDMKHIDDST